MQSDRPRSKLKPMRKEIPMRKISLIIVIAFLVVCPLFASAVPEKNNQTELVNGHDITSGSPWLASCVENTIKDGTVASLKDDFYLYVNVDTFLTDKILPGYPSSGAILRRSIQNDKDLLSLFDDGAKAESEDAQLALDLYRMNMDWETRNSQGVKPLKKITDGFEDISDIDALTEYFETAPFEDIVPILFPFDTIADFTDSSNYVLVLAPSGLILGDSAEYSNLTEAGKIKKEANSEFVLYMLQRLGYDADEAGKKLNNCFELETKLAPSMMTLTENNAPAAILKKLNYYTVEELEKLQGSVPVLGLIKNYGYSNFQKVLVLEPEWLKTLSGLYNNENLTLIKDYLIVWSAMYYAGYLDRDCFVCQLDCSNAILGVTGYLPDEQYALDMVQSHLPWQIAKLYCEKFVTETDKAAVKSIMEKVIEGYSEMLSENTFLSSETKEKALEKLNAISLRSLYPDDWSPYSYQGLVLSDNGESNLIKAVNRIAVANQKKKLEKFSKPVDKTYWSYGIPTVVNAFYIPMDNSINMLAAFCRGELYNSGMPVEEVYAKIGFVIGHEISHAFDGNGSNYDIDGNINNWWTEEDRTAFSEKIQKIADFAGRITYWDNVYLNGTIMTGEICADMGGMSVILRMAKSIPDFDYDLFFRSYAQLWESVSTYNYAVRCMSDVHPIDFFRINGVVQQFDEFLDCYGIKEGDGMYLAPAERVAVW